MAQEGISVPDELLEKLPDTGNVVIDKGTNTEVELSEEEKLKVAEQEIAKKEAKDKADKEAKEKAKKGKGKDDKGDEGGENQEDEPTEEEIQAKLDELGKKDEKDLTDEDKAYIEKYTQEQVDEITAVKNDIEQTYGIKLEGEYGNDIEGFKALANEVAPKIAEAMLQDYFTQIPYMKDFFDHVTNGKSIETFLARNEKPAFERIELKPLADVDDASKEGMVSNYKSIISMDMKLKGMADDDINNLINLYEANGSLYDKARGAKETLGKTHKANVDARIKQEEDALKQEEENNKKVIAELDRIITTNSFNGSQIPVADVKAFKDAMFRPVNQNGDTIMDVKRSKLNLEQRALIDYIIFKDFKVTGLATKPKDVKKFEFKKNNEENDKRKGGRMNNSGSASGKDDNNIKGTSLDIKSFLASRQQ